jgi:HK97 family phage prohead protease
MTRETKLISLADFKAKTDGPGGFEGYISRWGELDDGGDIVAKGAHEETIPRFLENGFLTNNHDWTFASILGYPVKATEDDEGTLVGFEFHSTPDAQAARTKTIERMRAGKSARLSMGYQPTAAMVIEPKDYATEIPKYSKPAFVASNIEKAGRFPMVRVLLKDDLFEGALVGMPMLGSASVTAVKSLTDGLGTGLEYSDHILLLGTAIKEFADRTQARVEMRTKEGRVFSSANYDELVSLYERLGKLLESATPKPKET